MKKEYIPIVGQITITANRQKINMMSRLPENGLGPGLNSVINQSDPINAMTVIEKMINFLRITTINFLLQQYANVQEHELVDLEFHERSKFALKDK